MPPRKARASRRASNVIHVDWRQDSILESAEESVNEPRRVGEAWGLAILATAAVVVAGGYFVMFEIKLASTDTMIATSANESKTHKLADGSVVSLGARSKLRFDVRRNRRHVRLLDGEAMFDVAPNMTTPFVVSTFLVDASTSMGAKFSVIIDTSVSVQVHEGVVEVSNPGAEEGAMVITLKEGNSYRVPVGGFRPVVADGGARTKAKRIDG